MLVGTQGTAGAQRTVAGGQDCVTHGLAARARQSERVLANPLALRGRAERATKERTASELPLAAGPLFFTNTRRVTSLRIQSGCPAKTAP